MARTSSWSGRLARRGFVDVPAALAVIAACGLDEADADALTQWCAVTADPDLALVAAGRLADAGELATLLADETRARRVLAAAAVSPGMVDALVQHPAWWRGWGEHPEDGAEPLALRPREEVHARLQDAARRGLALAAERRGGGADEVRLEHRRLVTEIAAVDATSEAPLDVVATVGEHLADVADATVAAALEVARAEVGPAEADLVRLGVVALGKTGGGELNYDSDVDVLYVAEPASDDVPVDRALRIATRLASSLQRICAARSSVGAVWPLDPNLRPEGRAGPLVRTLASHEAYYDRWAHNWEFQAMLKARPMAGDLALATAFVEMVQPRVWAAGERERFVGEVRATRRRVVATIPARERDRDLKLAEGGLRDVEFTVQLVQLVHGRVDESIRQRGTLAALAALVEAGYLGRDAGDELAHAYRVLRALEHRSMLSQARRTHLLPEDDVELRRLGRGLRLHRDPELPERVRDWWRRTRRAVLALHRAVFYSPVLDAVARIRGADLPLSREAATRRLGALGYEDGRVALGHIEALTAGISRKANIQRQLMPAMLEWFAEGPNPDLGLLSFRRVSDTLHEAPWFLRALRDEGAMAQRLARVLSTSRYLTDLLGAGADEVRLLGSLTELQPRPAAALAAEVAGLVERHDDPARAVRALRALRRRELFRIGAADLLGLLDLAGVGCALSDVTRVTVDAALTVARRRHPDLGPLALLALGRWGGGELSYGSDADTMAVLADGSPESIRLGTAVVDDLRGFLGRSGPEPPLVLDLDLRPEGRNGPLVRGLASTRAYYARWSRVWESQAMLRASHGAGDVELGVEVLHALDPLRYPDGGLSEEQRREIGRTKARVEAERLPRGVERWRHLKLGPGGLSDVEWVVQLLQLEHAASVEGLRTTSTLEALAAASEAGLLAGEDAESLREAWTMASRLRNLTTLVRGRTGDVLPDAGELAAVADAAGYGSGRSSHLVEEWRRVGRRARRVTEAVLWP